MVYALWLLAGTYAFLTLVLCWSWQRLPVVSPALSSALPSITVVIPVRNEAHNLPHLLADLARQTYPQFDVIVADDASTDATASLAEAYARTAPFPLTVLRLADDPTIASPKKRAIAQSIDRSTGTLIVTTDGDCHVGPRWLESIAHFQAQTEAKLISGPVTFTTTSSVFGSLQVVEFASLIGSGAATLALGRPTMCNGANLCYQKAVFQEVSGFAGVDHVASGDDELLMHKIAARYPGGVRFLKSEGAVVETAAHESLSAFYRQRKRWAGKWRTYTSLFPTVVAVFVFFSSLVPLLAMLGYVLGYLTGNTTLGIVLLKLAPEWLFLGSVLAFLQKRRYWWWIPATQLIYPFYVTFFGIAAQRQGVVWKGRKLK